jgi:hypothetical protein
MTLRALLTLVILTSVLLPACGGRQRPPAEGSCRAGREWVAPRQENGQWVDGYCRDAD